MLQGLLGRRPRLTAYFGVLAAGLTLLVVGVEATRIRLFGSFGQAASIGYAGVGVLGGVILAFVVGYLSGSLIAGWFVGSVPAAGRYGARYLVGTAADPVTGLLGIAGVGLVLGATGFTVAMEKHRRDSLPPDAPASLPRLTTFGLSGASMLAGLGCLWTATVL